MRNRIAISFEEYSKLHPATKKTRNDPMFSEPQKQEARPTAPAQKQPAQVEEHRRNPSNNTVSGSPKVDHQISTYLNKMKDMVDNARAGGDKPPNFDLCEVSVSGTNLFCGGNRGIERKDMPQLKGKPADGTPASKLPVGADGEVSVEKPFVDALKSKGVKMQQKTVDASHLKSTQNQLVGSKVVGMIGALQKDPKNPDITAPIFVSKDGYVLDGHHRWAAVVGLNFFTDKPVNMNVIEVDMGIDDLVNFTNQFADQMGIRQKAARLRLIAASLKFAGNNEPTNPSLWDKVQKLTKGEMKSLTHGGKTVDGPNDGKGFKIFPCVPLDSEALTPNGWKGYEDLFVGDDILTFNLESQCFEWNKIEHLHFYENAPVKRMFKSTTGWDIVCTENHKWVTQARDSSRSKGDPNLWGPVTLTEFKDLKTRHKIITSAPPLSAGTSEQKMEGFSKYGDSWVTKVINMTPSERHAFFAAGIVFDGHEHNQKNVKTYGGSQKNSDHADAFALSGYLSGYNVSFNKKKDNNTITAFTFTSRRHQCLVNLITEDAGTANVWCPTTKNQTWVMRQKKSITITGNSAYANGWASKTYKDLGGGWKKKKTAGGNTFFTVSSGSTAKDAFENARSMALGEYASEYGEYEGYSGTIAEKHNFVMIDLPKGEDAYKYAEKLIDDGDRRIDDKWGPAGCIKLSAGKFLFFGWASS